GREEYEDTEKPENLVTWIYDGTSFTPVAKVTDGERYTIVHDYLGTPTQAYDSRGNLVWEMLLDVYGEVKECHGDRTLVPFRYQGQYEDKETGLYYNRFRYYSPQMGMYISTDPIGLAGNNPTLYGYVSDINIGLDILGLMCRRGPKTKKEGGPHNDKIGETAKALEDDGWTIKEGGNRMPERLHETGGLKSRRPDIVAEKGNETRVYNVGKTKKDGTPIKREQEAIDDLKTIFDDVRFIPYDK
ncbi:RHS repeat domain-containing protein, partial [Phocaeicola plebeius]|uniref:RHS repeat domain-containing protein n=1 Tax=Phocaeicola plebeius TaxID=310297 RepID=UPI0023DFB749